MPFFRFSPLLAVGVLLILSVTDLAKAQIVRRFAGGGIEINAPFVRVNVGPGGATSVRAPFVAVDRPGLTFLGRRRRLMSQPQNGAPPQNVVRNTRSSAQRSSTQRPSPPTAAPQAAKPPERADIDSLPYPTANQMAVMSDAELVETLRQMMARFHYRLSLLTTGEGWQKYLVLSRETLGSPGAPSSAAHMSAVQEVLPRYQSVQEDPQFTKISTLPSFVATLAALQEIDRQLGGVRSALKDNGSPKDNGLEITDSHNRVQPATFETPSEESLEILPTPQSITVPNATRGERSILKLK